MMIIIVRWLQSANEEVVSDVVTGLPFTYEQLHLTKHAKERMKCRTITQEEIYQVLNGGIINEKKSEFHADACSTKYAVEGKSLDGQSIRLIVAPCSEQLNVITVIDLENNYDCE